MTDPKTERAPETLFENGGCLPAAFAYCANLTNDQTLALASTASKLRNISQAAPLYRNGTTHLGSFRGDVEANLNTLALMAGVKIVDFRTAAAKPLTLKQWLKTHTSGRYVAMTRTHALAVLDGQPKGYWKPRMRVVAHAKLEPLLIG